MSLVFGIDASPVHGAVCAIQEGKLIGFRYYTANKSVADLSEYGTRIYIKAGLPNLQMRIQRTGLVHTWFEEAFDSLPRPNVIAFEDYAFGAKQGAHQIGETGYVIRKVLLEQGVTLVALQPTAIKKFVAGKGNAKKLVAEVRDTWGEDFSRFIPVTRGKPGNEDTAGDLADAYGAAMLVRCMSALQQGRLSRESLNQAQLEVFYKPKKKGEKPFIEKGLIF